jgi:hypothetical protein
MPTCPAAWKYESKMSANQNPHPAFRPTTFTMTKGDASLVAVALLRMAGLSETESLRSEAARVFEAYFTEKAILAAARDFSVTLGGRDLFLTFTAVQAETSREMGFYPIQDLFRRIIDEHFHAQDKALWGPLLEAARGGAESRSGTDG